MHALNSPSIRPSARLISCMHVQLLDEQGSPDLVHQAAEPQQPSDGGPLAIIVFFQPRHSLRDGTISTQGPKYSIRNFVLAVEKVTDPPNPGMDLNFQYLVFLTVVHLR